MIPELGLFSLILALVLAFILAVGPLLGVYYKNNIWMQMARPLSIVQSLFIILSFWLLAFSFYSDDFTLQYVVKHSNSTLPLGYKLSALWAGHEGSLLLWILILSGWTVAITLRSRKLPLDFAAIMLSIMGFLSFGFLVFLLTTSNPFVRYLPAYPLEGNDLNPLLQDLGLIIHPPLLYLGYVGFALPFAFALACLWKGKMEIKWMQWVRPPILLAFCFLTLGIALGSFWAYYELGWGGWWFWDPVENASFMPWVLSIALIHCLIVAIKRQLFQGWVIFLSILTFSLCLLGTFLVRSGLLTSVHAFVTDPKRGVVLLHFLMIIIGIALILYAKRAHHFIKKSSPSIKTSDFAPYSRESLLFIGTVFLLLSTAVVLLGTLFPLIYEIFTHKQISVGFPYFNLVFIPLFVPVLLLLPLGPFTQWQHDDFFAVARQLKWPFFLSILLSFISPSLITKDFSILLSLSLLLGAWVCLGTLQRLWVKIKKQGFKQLSMGTWGMVLAHFGMGVMVLGISLVSYYHIERTVSIAINDHIQLGTYKIHFKDFKKIEGPNFVSYQGQFLVYDHKGQYVTELLPEKRMFVMRGISMSETAIDPGFFRDIYIALGEKLSKNSWSARIYYKPFVRWIWLGLILMGVGAVFSALKKSALLSFFKRGQH